MRFNPSRSLIFFAAVVLASSSLLLCTSASPVALDLGLALHKRAPIPTSKEKAVRAESTTPAAATHETTAATTKETSAAVKTKPPATTHATTAHSSAPAVLPSGSSASIAPSNVISGASETSGEVNTTSPSVTQASVNSQSDASVSTGLSTPVIGAIAGVGGVIVVAAGFFAVVRYRKQNDLTKKVSNSANPFTVPGNVQSSAAISASPFPPHSPYERLDDPKPVGTFTVISTYTPTLGDELDIQPGDKVTVLVEYDDGWVQGVNESRGRQKGVFPKHCVDYGLPYEDNRSSMLGGGGGGDKRVKRVSSMYGTGGAFGN